MTVSRTILALFVGVLLGSGLAPAQDDGPFVSIEKDKLSGQFIEPGTKAPDFEVKDLDANTVTLADFKGKYLVLVFWATTGVEPTMLIQRFRDYADYFEAADNVELFGIAAQKKPADVRPFLEENGLTFFRTGYTTEASLVRAYKATRLPVTYVIDPEGIVIAAMPYFSSTKVDEITAFLAEEGIGPGSDDEPSEASETADEEQAQDPQAVEILRAMCDAHKNAESMKYTSELVFSWEGDQPGQQTRKISAVLKKPNLARVDVEIDSQTLGYVVSDGTRVWEYNAELNEFVSSAAPANLAQPTQSRLLRLVNSLLFQDDPYAAVSSEIQRLSYEGDATTADGRECAVIVQDHGAKGVYRVFVDKETNLVARIEGKISGAGPAGALITMVEDKTCELDPSLDEGTFRFVPPEGAKEAEVVQAPKILEDEAEETEQGGGEEGR